MLDCVDCDFECRFYIISDDTQSRTCSLKGVDIVVPRVRHGGMQPDEYAVHEASRTSRLSAEQLQPSNNVTILSGTYESSTDGSS